MIFNVLVFLIIFGYLSNHVQFRGFFVQLKKSKVGGEKIEDKFITKLLKDKTGLNVKEIFLFDLNRPMGMMPGLPFKPHMILTRGLYKNFNKDELEYVVLHEAGHCLSWHLVKAIAIFSILAIVGIALIIRMNMSLIFSAGLGIVLVVIFNNLARLLEYEADYFAVKRVENPKGMITATEKFAKAYGGGLNISFWRKLFHRAFYVGVPYSDRIRIAKTEIK